MKPDELATKSDIEELKKMIDDLISKTTSNKYEDYLRSRDVRKMLNISDGTLQRMRISGAIKAKKINGTWFYLRSNIDKQMEVKNE